MTIFQREEVYMVSPWLHYNKDLGAWCTPFKAWVCGRIHREFWSGVKPAKDQIRFVVHDGDLYPKDQRMRLYLTNNTYTRFFNRDVSLYMHSALDNFIKRACRAGFSYVTVEVREKGDSYA
jgi:hypothetical protein